MVRDNVIATLWNGQDPFQSFPRKVFAVDYQGWNSKHRYLQETIREFRPPIVVEVGVWKGGSVLEMAQAMKDNDVDGVIIAVDTWLGSREHMLNHDWRAMLGHVLGYPTLFHTFMANVLNLGLEKYVIPLPMDSINAFGVLQSLKLAPTILHIDAGHDKRSVMNDLNAWWPFLKPSGALIGDDYYAAGVPWPDVKQAFDEFFAANTHRSFESEGAKCLIKKSA